MESSTTTMAGFCGTSSPTAGLPIDHHRLVARMIEEMGGGPIYERTFAPR